MTSRRLPEQYGALVGAPVDDVVLIQRRPWWAFVGIVVAVLLTAGSPLWIAMLAFSASGALFVLACDNRAIAKAGDRLVLLACAKFRPAPRSVLLELQPGDVEPTGGLLSRRMRIGNEQYVVSRSVLPRLEAMLGRRL